MSNSTEIRPLFLLPKDANTMAYKINLLNQGQQNQHSQLLINAKNDAQAISTFLREHKDSATTLISYAKEIERLLLWCIHVSRKNITTLRREDLMAYQTFLKNPVPRKQWCGPRAYKMKKDGSINSAWRPFIKGLGKSSITKSLKIIDALFNYLVQCKYLSGNPLAVDRRRKKRNQTKNKLIDRYLELDEIHAVLNALDKLIKKDRKMLFKVTRAKYIILLLFYTGLRINEVSQHRMGNFIQRRDNWFLRIIGKGKKLREIPVPEELLIVLREFRTEIGLPCSKPKYRERTPLIPMQNLKDPIGVRRIDQILKWAFRLGSITFEVKEPRRKQHINRSMLLANIQLHYPNLHPKTNSL